MQADTNEEIFNKRPSNQERNGRSINMMGGMMGGLGLIGLLFNLAVIVGIVVLVIWAVRRFSSDGQISGLLGQQNNRTSKATPREIAEERYAQGEITREQYQEMLSDLS
jgi:putative membrane protein